MTTLAKIRPQYPSDSEIVFGLCYFNISLLSPLLITFRHVIHHHLSLTLGNLSRCISNRRHHRNTADDPTLCATVVHQLLRFSDFALVRLKPRASLRWLLWVMVTRSLLLLVLNIGVVSAIQFGPEAAQDTANLGQIYLLNLMAYLLFTVFILRQRNVTPVKAPAGLAFASTILAYMVALENEDLRTVVLVGVPAALGAGVNAAQATSFLFDVPKYLTIRGNGYGREGEMYQHLMEMESRERLTV